MTKKLIATFIVFAIIGAVVFGVGAIASPDAVALPGVITADSACPVAGCTQADGACHASGVYPTPDGTTEMVCPHVKGCASTECHAFDRISEAGKPSDVSLNLWIIAPTLLALGLVALVRRLI
jgi:hypothetical protein